MTFGKNTCHDIITIDNFTKFSLPEIDAMNHFQLGINLFVKLTTFLIFVQLHTSMNSTIGKKNYAVVITKDEAGGFIGECEELHAYSQGETFGEMMENIKEAVELAAEDEHNEFNLLIIQK